ncbi:hypothetical protein [Actinomadura chokoriensis]|uniref:hypothetical protein n=1 Tax=Actinomadura chokoriensis TaxID=454156 RepID=UPI0031F81F6C
MKPLVAVPGLNFARYWWRGEEGAFAELLIDHLAARQIVDEALTSRDREVVAVFMESDCDVKPAAARLEIQACQFRRLLREARERFLACWHEGETPSWIWIKDRRLAMVQARGVAARLEELANVQVEGIQTAGDRHRGHMGELGGKGAFMREIDRARC